MFLLSEDEDTRPFVTEGILAGTQIACEAGWCEVSQIRAGDRVMTLEEGAAPVVGVQLALCSAELAEGWPEAFWPLLVPAEALGNPEPLRLLPEQPVLLEYPPREPGGRLALVPASALEGWRGIARVAPQPVEQVFTLLMENDCLVLAAGRVLLSCPADGQGLPPGLVGAEDAWWELLELPDARRLIGQIAASEDEGLSALGFHAPQVRLPGSPV